VRNARAAAGVPASARLPLTAAVPAALAPIARELKPAIERLARAEPFELRSDANGLASATRSHGRVLTIVAGQIEAAVALGDGATAGSGVDARERGRIEKELAQAEAALTAARARLADATFLTKAPPHIVDGARSRASELADRVEKLRTSLG
jgi:valyl-tRNA synthetase